MKKTIGILFAGIVFVMLIAAGCTSPAASTPATAAATPVATPVATTAAAADMTAAATAAPEATTAAPAANETAAPAVNATNAEPASWNGIWNTSYSVKDSADMIEILTLTQNGSAVTGSYSHGNGTVVATAKDSIITGTWKNSDDTGAYSGFFVFEKSADDKSFKGLWVNTAEGEAALQNTTQYWNGVRA